MSKKPEPKPFSDMANFLFKVQNEKLKNKAKGDLSLQVEYERKNILDLNILVGVDISGSISQGMFHAFTEQLHKIKGMSKIKVCEVGSRIAAFYDFEFKKGRVAKLEGGGGNGEYIFFPFAKKVKPDAIIYMTDGYCTDAIDPGIPTGFVITLKGIMPYKWGEFISRLPV